MHMPSTPSQRDETATLQAAGGWSEDLEAIHEESSRSHSVDVWTREVMVSRLGTVSRDGLIIDVGCSSGYLLEDLRDAMRHARLVGVDLVMSGLRKASHNQTGAAVAQADVCDLPFADAVAEAVVSANLLEHVPDDGAALREMYRILRPGGRAVLVVPMGPGTFDYYDRFLQHQRRYDKRELAAKVQSAGFIVIDDISICTLIYPPFWLVKKYHRWKYPDLGTIELRNRVESDIAATKDSAVFRLACKVEQHLLAHGVALPFGIRGLVVAERPEATR